mgnify:CR=1 FL=1
MSVCVRENVNEWPLKEIVKVRQKEKNIIVVMICVWISKSNINNKNYMATDQP